MEKLLETKKYLGKIKAFRETDDLFDEKVGEVLWDFSQNDDISTRDMGEVLNLALMSFKTEAEIEAAEKVLVALLGEGIFEIYEMVERRDAESYPWYCKALAERGC